MQGSTGKESGNETGKGEKPIKGLIMSRLLLADPEAPPPCGTCGRLRETGYIIYLLRSEKTGWGSFLGLAAPVLCLPLVKAEHAPTARKCPQVETQEAVILHRAVFKCPLGSAKECGPGTEGVCGLSVALEPLCLLHWSLPHLTCLSLVVSRVKSLVLSSK